MSCLLCGRKRAALSGQRPPVGTPGSSALQPKETLAAWVAVALTPVGLFLAVVAGFAWAEAPASGIATSSLGTVPAALLAVIAPTAAVIMAIRAARAGERSGRIALAVSVLLLLGMLVWLGLGFFSLGWIIALVMVAAVLAVFGWHSRHNRLPPAG